MLSARCLGFTASEAMLRTIVGSLPRPTVDLAELGFLNCDIE